MRVISVQAAPWDKIWQVAYEEEELAPYDKVVLKTDQGLDLATVVETALAATAAVVPDAQTQIIRRANAEDCASELTPEEKRRTLQSCYELIKRLNLEMKLVDAAVSLDGTRLTFAFVAGGRVDFRELVKELAHHFNKTIRLQQIGIRDEARAVGDQGRCGRGLCCRGHLGKFSSVTSDMAEAQNLAGRGSDRLSGTCGRLMCCLAYEMEGYQETIAKMPPLGARLTVDGKKGVVVGHHPLKQSVDLKVSGAAGENDYTVEVPLKNKSA